MHGENGTPETPDWIPPAARPWDESRCCPTDCGLCESPQHHVFLNTPDSIIRGEN